MYAIRSYYVEGGMPIKINIGVIKKPPPTPNNPDITPINPPNPNKRKILTEVSAIGRYICIITSLYLTKIFTTSCN